MVEMKYRSGFAVIFLFLTAAGSCFAEDILKLRPVLSGYVDATGSGLKQPEGVGCGGESMLVVADTGNGRIVLYSVIGETLSPRATIVLPELPYPMRVRVDSKGNIFVLDGKLRRIARLSPSGEFRGYVDPVGLDAPIPMAPRSFQIDKDDNLYVLDVNSARVLVLGTDGKYQREIAFPKEYGFFSDLAVDSLGNLFLVDSVGRTVFHAKKDSPSLAQLSGNLKEDVNFPVGIAVDNRGNLLIVDQNGSGIVILGTDGSFRGRQLGMGWKEGLLRYPSQICINNKGIVFIADRGNNRVQMYSIPQ